MDEMMGEGTTLKVRIDDPDRESTYMSSHSQILRFQGVARDASYTPTWEFGKMPIIRYDDERR